MMNPFEVIDPTLIDYCSFALPDLDCGEMDDSKRTELGPAQNALSPVCCASNEGDAEGL